MRLQEHAGEVLRPGSGRVFLLVLVSVLGASAAAPQTKGARLYQQNCSTCHGLDGRGLASATPPLAGHAPRLLSAPGGRSYLPRVLLFGIVGEIQVEGRRYSTVMAPFDFRDDAELAAILNHVLTAWGNDRLLPRGHQAFTAGEVAQERAKDLSPEAVRAGRPAFVPSPQGP